MKKIEYNKIILAAFCLIISLAVFTGCDKDDSSGQVALHAFGPSPVLRGGEISFIGNNLDKVTGVLIPGCSEITTIDRVSATKIKVTVPQEAEEGHVTLKYKGGEIVTKAMLSYTEPYEITSIAPTDEAVREGNQITITGDYLWNIVAVQYTGNEAIVDAEDFISQERKSIILPVHKAAASGKIKIIDEEGNELYSDQELIVTQPAITGIAPATIKAGAELTVSGTDLDLVESIRFASGTFVLSEKFVSQSATEIVLVVPEDTKDGAIRIIAFSAIESDSEGELTMVVPDKLAVKAVGKFKAGEGVEITGDDMDLVTALSFADGVEAEFTYSGGKITAIIPATAVDGTITLSTAAGKSVETPAITLVKPVITGLTPATIIAGEEFKVIGTDLDLVVSVKIGTTSGEIVSKSASELTIGTPLNTRSGIVAVTTENGITADSPAELNVNPSTKPTVSTMPESAKPGEEITLEGTNLNNVKSVLFAGVEVMRYTERTAERLVFFIPEDAPTGTYRIYFEVYEGEDVETDNITILSDEFVIFDVETDLGSWSASFRMYKETFVAAGVKAGDTLRFYTTPYGSWPQIQINDANWGGIITPAGGGVTEVIDITLTQDFIDRMMNTDDGWSTTALIVQGEGAIIHKVVVVSN